MKPLACQTNELWLVRRLLTALFAVSLSLSGIAAAHAAVVITYFQNDAAGTPVVATSATGTVIWRETHQPYGVRHTQQAEVASYPLQFTGHAEDPDTGMVYTGARMYDPSLARFTGADPAPIEPANPRSFTRYGYGNNNPYRNVDPDGESPIDIAFLAADTLKLSLAIYSGNAAAIESTLGAEAASLVGVFNPIPFSGQAMKAAVFASRIKAAEKGIAGVEKAAKGASKIDRVAFRTERQAFWKTEAKSESSRFSADDLARMEKGKAPKGSDGYSMELHHKDRTMTSELEPMTRTDHRLGANFKKNHPND